MNGPETWTCPTCNEALVTRYCPACGEGAPRAQDLTLAGLARQLFQSVSSIDGRLLRTIRCLLRQPGALTVAYVGGQRKPWLGPFQLFFLANVLFFATQPLTNTSTFASTLDSHLHRQDWSPLAERLVADRLASQATSLELYAPAFDQAVIVNAKSLIILMTVPLALLLPVVFYRNRQPFVAHAVFSLHFFTFLLLIFCAASALAALQVLLGGPGLDSPRVDHTLAILVMAACGIFLYSAIRRVYGVSGLTRLLQMTVLTVAVAAIVLGYRFLIFLITLYST